MKPRIQIILLSFLLALSFVRQAGPAVNQTTEEHAIRMVVEQYFHAMKNRDVEELRNVMGLSVSVLEAGRPTARVEVVNAGNAAYLLPPEENDEWEDVTLASLKIQISRTHPSVASVTFGLFRKLSQADQEVIEDLVTTDGANLSDEEWMRTKVLLDTRGIRTEMFALLAREEGRWKLSAVTVPPLTGRFHDQRFLACATSEVTTSPSAPMS